MKLFRLRMDSSFSVSYILNPSFFLDLDHKGPMSFEYFRILIEPKVEGNISKVGMYESRYGYEWECR